MLTYNTNSLTTNLINPTIDLLLNVHLGILLFFWLSHGREIIGIQRSFVVSSDHIGYNRLI